MYEHTYTYDENRKLIREKKPGLDIIHKYDEEGNII
jgi:uncharacterized protein with von Willebrand factor type A (vWA) domain